MKGEFHSKLRAAFLSGLMVSSVGCLKKVSTGETAQKLKIPTQERAIPMHSIAELRTIIDELNPKIGVYPTRLKGAQDVRTTYKKWSDAFLDAKAYVSTQGDTEETLWTLAELSRQGHNMDVENTGVLAGQVIEKCLVDYPESVLCHFSSADFYLSVSVTGETLANAERSLRFLRSHIAPKINESVEENYIYLYYYDRKPDEALRQIDRYLKLYPKSPKKQKLLEMKADLRKQMGKKD